MTGLPPTTPELLDPEHRPYFTWWADLTVGDLHVLLEGQDLELRRYWTAAILREGNTRDVWLFLDREQVVADWEALAPRLGDARARWSWLLGIRDRRMSSAPAASGRDDAP